MSVRPTYPVVLLPPRLEAALTARPELPTYTVRSPQPEDFPADLSAGKSLLSSLYRFFGLKVQAAELTAPERRLAQQRFEAAQQMYERARSAFWDDEARKWTPMVMLAFRQRQVAAPLESSAQERVGESSALAGPAEGQFYMTLERHFPGLILRRRRLRAGPEDYHPDYLLADPASRLRIDIELDEPYTLRRQTPIHFVEQDPVSGEYVSLDAARDRAFLTAGWPVLRFSEAQTVNDPDGCARVVAEVLERLTGRVTLSLAEVRPVAPEPRWTRQEANVMASQDSRTVLLAGVPRREALPVAQTPERPFVPSAHQTRIFDFLEHGQGHGLVVAVAGSGKSTTLLQAVQTIRRGRPAATIALLAFNRSIKDELQAKLRDAGLHGVEVATLNGFGHRVLLADRGGPARLILTKNKERGVLVRAAETLGRRLSLDDLKRAANLCRAVKIGGEGGSLLLLGPYQGEGEFFFVSGIISGWIEDDIPVYSGARLIPAGRTLIGALNFMQPHWRRMTGVHVAPQFEIEVQAELQRNPDTEPYEDWRWRWSSDQDPSELVCTAIWPDCDYWPDGVVRDACRVEGNLDEVRAVLGRVPYEHQVQLQTRANEPFVMILSRDSSQRYALPEYDFEEEGESWLSHVFQPIRPVQLTSLDDLLTLPAPPAPAGNEVEIPADALVPAWILEANPGVLFFEPAMRHYEALRVIAGSDVENLPLPQMAQLTWPMQVLRFRPAEIDLPHYTVMHVVGMGMEHELVTLIGDEHEHDSVRISIALRNTFFVGQRDALNTGELDYMLSGALLEVDRVNRE